MPRYDDFTIQAAARTAHKAAYSDPRRYAALLREMSARTGLPPQTVAYRIQGLAHDPKS